MTSRDQLVVGAAVLRAGRLLAAHRPDLDGWEFPGGKVEPGETPEEALVREVREELGVEVRVGEWLEGEVPVRPGLVLRVALADLVAGEPVAHEHDDLRWVPAEELADLPWLPADRPFLAGVSAALGRP